MDSKKNTRNTGRHQIADSLYFELLYVMHEGDSVYRIAADQSIYTNSYPSVWSVWNPNGNLTEPILSKRIIYEMRPAKRMADSLELCKNTEKYLEVHEMMAPTGRRLYLGPDYRFYDKEIDVNSYKYKSWSNYFYHKPDDPLGDTIKQMKDNGKWLWSVDGGDEQKASDLAKGNNATTKLSSGQFIEAYCDTVSTHIYTLRYKINSNYYNVAKFHVTYLDVDAVGPWDSLPAPTRKMELLYENKFNYDEPGKKSGYKAPGKGDFTFWEGHFKMDESTYGYYFPAYRDKRGHHYTIGTDAEPNWSEYGVVNAQDAWIDTKVESVTPWVYNHVDSINPATNTRVIVPNVIDNAKKGYMIFVDGSQQPGLVFNLEVEADLCPGSTMYFSAWIADASSRAYNSGNIYRSAPNLDFIVIGEKGDKEHILTTFTTGEFGINAPDSTSKDFTFWDPTSNHMERAKWYQVMFPVKFDGDIEYDKYRLKIMNKGKSSDGNDFCIDDISIYVQKPPVMPIQASTSDCVDKARDSIRAYLRIDYQEIEHDGRPIYYQWREKDENDTPEKTDKIVRNRYYNEAGPSTTFGKITIPTTDEAIEATGLVSTNLFAFDADFRETEEPVYRFIKEKVDNVNERYVLYIAQPIEVRINHEYTGFVALAENDLGDRNGCGTHADMLIAGGTRITINDEITFGDSVVTVCGHRSYDLNIVLTQVIQDETQGELRVDTAHCRADWLIGDSVYVNEHPDIYKYSFSDIATGLDFYHREIPHPTAVQMVDFLKHHSLLILDTFAITMSPGISLSYTAFPLAGSAGSKPVCTSPRFLHIQPADPASNMMVVGKDASEYAGLPDVVKNRPRIIRISDAQRREGWFNVPLYRIGEEESYIIDRVYAISSTDPNWRSVALISDHDEMLVKDTIYLGNKEDHNDPINTAIQSLKPGYDYTFHVAFVGESDEDRCDRGHTYFTLRIVPDSVTWRGGKWNIDASLDYFIPTDETKVILQNQDYDVSFATNPTESYDFYYQRNHCSDIYIPAGASMANQDQLTIGGIAYVDYQPASGAWTLSSMPVCGIVSGDLFASQAESDEPFLVAHINQTVAADADDRYTYEVYQSPFIGGEWIVPTNQLDRPIYPGEALQVGIDCEEGAAAPVIRLPKPDTEYRYYRSNTAQWLGDEIVEVASKRPGTPGKPVYDKDHKTVTVKETTSGIYTLGNPTFGYIDLTALLAVNSDILTGEYSFDPAGDFISALGADPHVLLPPYRGVWLKAQPAISGDRTIEVTTVAAPAAPAAAPRRIALRPSPRIDTRGGIATGAKSDEPEDEKRVSELSFEIPAFFSPLFNTTVPSLVIERTLYKDGGFNTLCLPFDLDASEIAAAGLENAEIYAFSGATGDYTGMECELSQVTTMEAGVPYVLRWTGDYADGSVITELHFSNVDIQDAMGEEVGSNVKLVGHVARTSVSDNANHSNLFIGTGATLNWPKANDNTRMKGFRAHFTVPTSGPLSVPKGTPARLVIRANTPTDINPAVIDNQKNEKIMVNGMLYILRAGQVYNAQGQKVK